MAWGSLGFLRYSPCSPNDNKENGFIQWWSTYESPNTPQRNQLHSAICEQFLTRHRPGNLRTTAPRVPSIGASSTLAASPATPTPNAHSSPNETVLIFPRSSQPASYTGAASRARSSSSTTRRMLCPLIRARASPVLQRTL